MMSLSKFVRTYTGSRLHSKALSHTYFTFGNLTSW